MSNPPPADQSNNSPTDLSDPPTDPQNPPTDQSNTEQLYYPSDPFIEYSRFLYEHTLDQWWRMRRAEEERIASLYPDQMPEYHISVQLQYTEEQEQQHQTQNPDAPLDPPSEDTNDGNRALEPRPLDTKSEEDAG